MKKRLSTTRRWYQLALLMPIFLLLLITPIAIQSRADFSILPTTPAPIYSNEDLIFETDSGTVPISPAQQLPALGVDTNRDNVPNTSAATILQTLYVPAKVNSPVTTNFNLTQGVIYTIRATGLWTWGGCNNYYCPGGGPTYIRWGDAAYLTDDHFNHFSDPSWSSIIYLEINGVKANFGPYNDRHTYSTQLIGDGSAVQFKIQDCSNCYDDNSGSLRIDIFEGDAGEASDVGVKAFLQRSQRNTTDPNYNIAPWTWGEDLMQSMPASRRYRCGTTAQAGETRFCQYGCLVTSWAMLIDHWGHQYNFHTSPRELNKWLCENNGYTNGSFLVPHKAGEFVRKMTGKVFATFRVPGRNDTRLQNLINSDYPVILDLNIHFVLATGEQWSDQNRTWFINDPGGCGVDIYRYPLTTLAERYGNSYIGQQWGYELSGGGGVASLSIGLASPAELIVTDPSGLRTGYDPINEITYNENPDAFYYTEQLTSDDELAEPLHPMKWFDTNAPIEGDYIIQVTGTGSGLYNLLIQGYDQAGKPSSIEFSSQIEEGEINEYKITFTEYGVNKPTFLPLLRK